MIHLRKLSMVWSKPVLEFNKYPLSRPKLLGVLLKAECTASISQLIRFLSVEETSREPSSIAEDDTNKESTKVLSEILESTQSLDRNAKMRNLRAVGQFEDADSTSKLTTNMSIEGLRKLIKKADTQKLSEAMTVIDNLNSLLGPKYFPLYSSKKFDDVESLIPLNELKDVFETIERDLRFLNDTSLRKVLQACTVLKISDSSPLMQKLFKLLSSNINSMSSNSVLIIYCCLKEHYTNANQQVAALIAACNGFFKHCFANNMHPNTKATTLAYYVSLNYLPLNVKEFLIKKIFESESDLPFWVYSHVLKALILPEVCTSKDFHRECLKYIMNGAPKLLESCNSPLSVYFFLKSYRSAVSKGLLPYNESFLDAMALKIVKWALPLNYAIRSCVPFFQMSHFNYALFEYVASEAGSALSSGKFKTLSETDFYLLTKILSEAGKQHTKVVNSFFRAKLEEAYSFYPKWEDQLKILLSLNLATLGIYDDCLIEQCFTSKNGRELTEEDLEGFHEKKQRSLFLLYQAVVTFHPSYQKPLLSEKLREKLAAIKFVVSPTHNVWQEVVESCFGGANFVMKNCTTPLHHKLSYVVVLDKNNVPIDVASIQGNRATDEPFNIADIPTTEERQVIVIQDVWNEGQFIFKNVSCWKGKFQLYIDVLEVYCNGVIPLFLSELKSLSSFERVPFLLSKIEKKFGVIGKPMSEENEK